MDIKEKTTITVGTVVNAPVEKVWTFWTTPNHIMKWNQASEDWQTTRATNDLKKGGTFSYHMEARNGSMGFDFIGTYEDVIEHKQISIVLGDDRRMNVQFKSEGKTTVITENFEAESENSVELQKYGWQAILDNFKKCVESYDHLETLHFEINIDTKKEKVFEDMLDQKKFSEWTAEFNPTSKFKGSWDKNSKILFMGTNEDGSTGGMVSRIKENIENSFIGIEHMGVVKSDTEITSGPEVESWKGFLECYTFKELNGATLLLVDADTNQEFKLYFEESWPRALKKLKAICEA